VEDRNNGMTVPCGKRDRELSLGWGWIFGNGCAFKAVHASFKPACRSGCPETQPAIGLVQELPAVALLDDRQRHLLDATVAAYARR
jgi:hypothetical protein